MYSCRFGNWDIKPEVMTLSNNHICVFLYATLISLGPVPEDRASEGSWQRCVSTLPTWWSVRPCYACLRVLSPRYLLNTQHWTPDKKWLRATTCWAIKDAIMFFLRVKWPDGFAAVGVCGGLPVWLRGISVRVTCSSRVPRCVHNNTLIQRDVGRVRY